MSKKIDFQKLEKSLREIRIGKTSYEALDTVLDSKHNGAIEAVHITLKQRFLKLLLDDPDAYNAQKTQVAFDFFKYFSPQEAEIFEGKKTEKDEYWSLKKDSALLQWFFKLAMKSLIAYIALRMIYESISI